MDIYREVPNGPGAVDAARRLLDTVEPPVPEKVMVQARLVLAELVRDSFRQNMDQQGSSIHIRIYIAHGRLRLDVIDHRDFYVIPENTENLLSSLRGLTFVNRVTDDWGPLPEGGLWAELDLSKSRD
jgi:hypothetical protein